MILPDEYATGLFADDDYRVVYDEPFEQVKDELLALSVRLRDLLPDPSIGPQERLERLARLVPASVQHSQYRLTARTKLTRLRDRLDELVPEPGLSSVERVDVLVNRLHSMVPGDQAVIEKLETIGDLRGTDTGTSPRRWQ